MLILLKNTFTTALKVAWEFWSGLSNSEVKSIADKVVDWYLCLFRFFVLLWVQLKAVLINPNLVKNEHKSIKEIFCLKSHDAACMNGA